MVEADLARGQAPRPRIRARPLAAGDLGQRHVVMVDLAALVDAAVKAHRERGPAGLGAELGDLSEAQDLRPEAVRCFHVAHVEDQVVDAPRRLRREPARDD